MKRNIYITLATLSLFGIILFQSFFSAPDEKEFKFEINREKILQSPQAPLIGLFTSMYIVLFFIGIGNLVVFISRKARHKNLIEGQASLKQFPLSEESASRLLFLILALIFTIQGFEIIVFLAGWRANSLGAEILINLALELSIIFLVLNSLSGKWLDFSLKNKNLSSILQLYTAILPLVLFTLILSGFLCEKIGIKPSVNPAVMLFLSLKDKFLGGLLLAQIMIVGPAAEELFFRAFIYKLMRTKFSFLGAGSITSIFFSVLHKTPQDVLPLFIISISLCYLYEKTQSIAAPIVFHALHNSLNLVFLLLLKNFL